MSENIAIILSITSYKIMSLLVGLMFAYMGYKLFMAGVWGNAGDMDAQLKDFKLVLKKAAPGTFFVAFGTVVIGFTIFKGIEFNNIQGSLPKHATVDQKQETIQPTTKLPGSLPGTSKEQKE